MRENFIFNLKQPCRNHGVEMIDNGDGTVNLNGNRFETTKGCEDYLETCSRKDIVSSDLLCPCSEDDGTYDLTDVYEEKFIDVVRSDVDGRWQGLLNYMRITKRHSERSDAREELLTLLGVFDN